MLATPKFFCLGGDAIYIRNVEKQHPMRRDVGVSLGGRLDAGDGLLAMVDHEIIRRIS